MVGSETDYAKQIASVEVDSCRIERIFVKEAQQEEIRFSWWPNGRFAPRALDLPETDLIALMAKAIKEGVLSPEFLANLHASVDGR